MNDLPNELFVKILGFLPPLDVIRLKEINRRFNDLTCAFKKDLQRPDVFIEVKKQEEPEIVVEVVIRNSRNKNTYTVTIKDNTWATTSTFFNQFRLNNLEKETDAHFQLLQTLLQRSFESFEVNIKFSHKSVRVFKENIKFLTDAISKGCKITIFFLGYHVLNERSVELNSFLQQSLEANIRLVAVPEIGFLDVPSVEVVTTARQTYPNICYGFNRSAIWRFLSHVVVKQFEEPTMDVVVPFYLDHIVFPGVEKSLDDFCGRCNAQNVRGPNKERLQRERLPKKMTFSKDEKKITVEIKLFHRFMFGAVRRHF